MIVKFVFSPPRYLSTIVESDPAQKPFPAKTVSSKTSTLSSSGMLRMCTDLSTYTDGFPAPGFPVPSS